MDNELSELGRAPVRVSAVPHQEFGQMAELYDGKISGE